MTVVNLDITYAGPQVTVQDQGRFGLLQYGVPASGPMDHFAFAIANLALGNPVNTAAIEVSLGGLTLICTQGRIRFAVAGGDFQIWINKDLVGPWGIATLTAGDTLTIRRGRWGSWCYLAFAGNLQSKTWLGSHATHAPSDFGGGKLITGGQLVIENAKTSLDSPVLIPCPVSARPRREIRVVIGPQNRFFSQDTITAFLSLPFTLTDASDRMGVRLSGPPLVPDATMDMPSEAIIRGSVQVSGDGVATVLLADHQTTGGYPKIATILSDDLDGFVQLRSKGEVRFTAISPQAAIAAARTRHKSRAAYLAQIRHGRQLNTQSYATIRPQRGGPDMAKLPRKLE